MATRWSSTTWRSISRICRSSWRTGAGRCTWRRRSSSCDGTDTSGSTSPGFRPPACWSTFRACPRWPTAWCGAPIGRARASGTCARTSISSWRSRSPTRTSRPFWRPMRWLCSLLLASSLAGQTKDPRKPLRFDLTDLVARRDSFAFFFKGVERGYAVWQYEIRQLETTQEILYTAHSEFRPVEEERLRVVLNRLTGEPIATFHHIDLFSPASDTVMVEHDLEVKGGEIGGRRRVGTRSGAVKLTPVSRPLPPGTVLSDYSLFAAAVTNAVPGDSLAARAYSQFGDSLATLSFVAEAPVTIEVPAGRFEVLPLTSGGFRVFTTRSGVRRVVKGETLDGVFSFQLAATGPVVPSPQ